VRFEVLYARHAAAVKAYVLRRADATSADDVVAEVFVVCWRRFEEVPEDPLPWLLGVARRVLSTQRRGERRRVALRERLGGVSELESAAVQGIDDGALGAALARLSERDRELLLLIAWDGMSSTQAAAILGVKPATVRVRLLRARRRLTQALEHAESVPLPCTPLSMEVSP
jgi:RNA polymerase sigma-70 factor, ECF subfamily